MLLEENDVIERFESPANLLNRLRNELSNSHKHQPKARIPSMPPSAEDVIDDLHEKLKFGGLKTKAAHVMNQALDSLNERISEIQKPKDLAAIADTMNKIVNAENKSGVDDRSDKPQIIIYAPSFVKEETYQVIQADE